MLDKPLDGVTDDDLQDLVDDSVPESKELEYKVYLEPSSDNGNKTSLLAEVTSFANARGGDLIVGISEDDGVPESLGGIPLSGTPDQTVETWGNILRRQTEPKLPTTVYDIKAVPTDSNRHAIIVRVEKSWQGPHRVKTNDRFYGRHASGKFPMTVGEIREHIVAGQDQREQLKEFRADRISEYIVDDTPVPIQDGPRFLFHLVPHEAFSPGRNIDLSVADSMSKSPLMFVSRASAGGRGDRYMVDSVTKFRGQRQNEHAYYTRTFRNGAVEGYTSVGFTHKEIQNGYIKYLHEETVRETLERIVPDWMDFLEQQDVSPPLYAVTTLIDADEHTFLSDQYNIPMDPIPFEKEVLQLPTEVIESYDADIDEVISSITKSLWNAAGRKDATDY